MIAYRSTFMLIAVGTQVNKARSRAAAEKFIADSWLSLSYE
jgi:hypothetical protein